MMSLLREVVERYDVDGVQGDDRLPANPSIAGYDEWTVAEYRGEHGGREPPDDHLDADWIDWRASRLNQFAERMYLELKRLDRNLIVSAAPSIYPWSKREYLQDWPTWVREGWVDQICPQVYRTDLSAYRRELATIVREQIPTERLGILVPGVLVQTEGEPDLNDRLIEPMIRANRNLGILGEILFYDQAIVEHADVFRRLYRPELAR